MASIIKDVQWAFSGQPVALELSSGSGDRARFKLTSKPYDSGLALFDDNEQNFIESRGQLRCTITPDVPGTYGITAFDENVTTNVQHVFNDGGAAQSKGIATATVLASASETLYVGQVLTRDFGIEADRVTLSVQANKSDSYGDGVLTYYAGAGYAPTLTSATTPIAELAIQSTAVTTVRNYYGMASGYGGQSHIIGWDTFLEVPATQLTRIETGFYRHIRLTSVAVHDDADTTNAMTGVSVPTTEATLATYTNTFAGKVTAHLALATGAAHPKGADTTNSITVGSASTLSTARLRLINIRNVYEAHRVLNTTKAHYSPGDSEEDSISPWNLPVAGDSTSTVITFATTLASAWTNHTASTGYSSVVIHTATGSANDMYSRTGATWEELKELANSCADRFEAHCGNIVFETGSSASYHTTPDTSAKVPFRASDRKSTLDLIDYLHWAYLNHTVNGGGAWHSTPSGGAKQNTGNGYVGAVGATTRLQHALLGRLKGDDNATPPNTIGGVVGLISQGGFTKG
jgi:hypothetical protein